ncbi:MAG: alpha/beta hydrolase [Alphaproteobacteria bacterium]|nr:alpha/beta hydrolase [Alphaproteobacteria bacterium]
MTRKIRRLLSFLSPLLLGLRVSSMAHAQTEAGNPLTADHLIPIGSGRQMNMVCTGHGSPTVVFEYGLGGHMLNWAKVQPAISAITRACFYDRAGYGSSEPSSRPMTAENVTNDLYWLIEKAGIGKPFVLAAHSLGGLYATFYTDRFPSQVAGLVLIDPSFARQDLDETAEEQSRAQRVYGNSQAALARCAALAHAHLLSAVNPNGCFSFPAGLPPNERDYLIRQFLNPFRWDAMLSESRNLHQAGALSEDEQEEQRAATSWGNKPVIVLTAGLAPKQPDQSEEEHQKNMAHWKAGHDKLAARSTHGESIAVGNASHTIQLDQPQAVIEAIEKVVSEVQADRANRR